MEDEGRVGERIVVVCEGLSGPTRVSGPGRNGGRCNQWTCEGRGVDVQPGDEGRAKEGPCDRAVLHPDGAVRNLDRAVH